MMWSKSEILKSFFLNETAFEDISPRHKLMIIFPQQHTMGGQQTSTIAFYLHKIA